MFSQSESQLAFSAFWPEDWEYPPSAPWMGALTDRASAKKMVLKEVGERPEEFGLVEEVVEMQAAFQNPGGQIPGGTHSAAASAGFGILIGILGGCIRGCDPIEPVDPVDPNNPGGDDDALGNACEGLFSEELICNDPSCTGCSEATPCRWCWQDSDCNCECAGDCIENPDTVQDEAVEFQEAGK
jgi:hypothetical protein